VCVCVPVAETSPMPATPMAGNARGEAKTEASDGAPGGAASELPLLSPSPERSLVKGLGIGAVVADPANETREQFLERARKKLKCSPAKINEKARAVEGLWELWTGDEDVAAPATRKRKAKADPKAEPTVEPTVDAAPKAARGQRRGRPGSNSDLKDRLVNGGGIQDMEEYEKAQGLIRNEMKQQVRMLKAGKSNEATAVGEILKALTSAADCWADANGLERTRRVEEQQRNNDLQIRAGLQMISDGSRKNGELLTHEIRASRRCVGGPR
jgi:hypothetical protein